MKLILFILINLSFLSIGLARKCYVCSSSNKHENNCTDPFNKAALKEETCDITNYVCVKQKIPGSEGYKDNMFRGCVVKDYCTVSGKNSNYCEICDEDLCNSASTLIQTMALPFLFITRIVI
ncbi:hypothetical protein FQA39_LY17905 [Lamprigera yunnana]|nr:hypothetical protein FQA39_LY17905 [Lamprigera yunnana]